MIRQSLYALDQKTQETLESYPHCATGAPQGNSLQQQAFNQRPCVIRDEVLIRTSDTLAPAVFALMILFAIMNVAISFVLRRFALWTHLSDGHGLRLTFPPLVSAFGQQ
jgi:hypothetical protein